MKYIITIIYVIIFMALSLFFIYNYYFLQKNELQSISLASLYLEEEFKDIAKSIDDQISKIIQEIIKSINPDSNSISSYIQSMNYIIRNKDIVLIYPSDPLIPDPELPIFYQQNTVVPAQLENILENNMPLSEKIWLIDTYINDRTLDHELKKALFKRKFKLYYKAKQYNKALYAITQINSKSWNGTPYSYAVHLIQVINVYHFTNQRSRQETAEKELLTLLLHKYNSFSDTDILIITKELKKHLTMVGKKYLDTFESLVSKLRIILSTDIKWFTHDDITYMEIDNVHPVISIDNKNYMIVIEYDVNKIKTMIYDVIKPYKYFIIADKIDSTSKFQYTHPVIPGFILSMDKSYLITRKNTIKKERSNLLILFSIIFCIAISLLIIHFLSLRRERDLIEQKTYFINAVSHELRTPLAGIKISAQTLSLGRISDSQKIQKYAKNIVDQGDYLEKLINNILNFNRMKRGNLVLTFENLNPGDLCKKVLTQFTDSLVEKNINITRDIDEDLPDIMADRNALTRILLNLLENSVKYSHPPKKIHVICKCFNKNIISLSVTDNGIGIPQKYQKKIFSDFYRIPDKSTTGVKGTGLGLAMVKYMVDKHKGTIKIISEQNIGTTFTVNFPVIPGKTNKT